MKNRSLVRIFLLVYLDKRHYHHYLGDLLGIYYSVQVGYEQISWRDTVPSFFRRSLRRLSSCSDHLGKSFIICFVWLTTVYFFQIVIIKLTSKLNYALKTNQSFRKEQRSQWKTKFCPTCLLTHTLFHSLSVKNSMMMKCTSIIHRYLI